MTFYIVSNIIIVLLGLYGTYGKQKEFTYFCRYTIFFYLFFFSAVRYGIGTDYPHYEVFYKAVENGSKIVYRNEKVFYLLNLASIKLNFGYEIFICICSFITIFFFAKSVNKSAFIYEVLLFFALIYIQSFCLIRQMMACVIALYALKKCNNDLKSFLLLSISALIHSSFIIVLFMYVIAKFIKVSLTFCCFMIITSFFLFYYTEFLSVILNHLADLLNIEIGKGYFILSRRIGFVMLLRYVFMSGFIYIFWLGKVKNSFVIILILLIFVSEFIGTRMLIFASRMPQTFYMLFFIILKEEYWSKIKNIIYKKYSLGGFVFLTSFVLIYLVLYIQLMTGFKLNNVVPYKWIF